MARQKKQKRIWKIGIKQKLKVKDVEGVVAGAQKHVGKDFDALIERIDMKDKETNVFVSGNKDSVEAVEKNLKANLPKAKTVKAEVKKNDLFKLM
jgi:hypothetical protein